uniref:Uncharacterized protein n=1 Tax=Graphocephala atropunctata TaxID=36148 RepID=A0A1B6L586_9HEMI
MYNKLDFFLNYISLKMHLDFKETFLTCVILLSTFSSGAKKKKFKATTAILGDRIISLCDDILKLTLELPEDEGATLVEDTETLNSCIRQFVKLIYADDYYDKDIERVLAIGPQPKFLEVELDSERIATAKRNFGWSDRDIEDWFFQRLCTYQHWNHILTYKNHYAGMK